MTIRRVHVTTTVTAKSRDRSWIKPLASAALLSAAALLTSAVTARSADEADVITSHGYSFYGDLDYPADFTHFDYVNPEAPKGGELAIPFIGTLDSMNPYSGKGRAHAFSVYPYESLLADAAPADKYGQSYCLLCKSVEYPEDKSWVIFHMRPEAKFSDGTPVTALNASNAAVSSAKISTRSVSKLCRPWFTGRSLPQ